MAKRISFQEFCDEHGGPRKLAMDLGMGPRVVYDYYNKKVCPSVPVMTKMIALSLGRLDYNAIIYSCYSKVNGVTKG